MADTRRPRLRNREIDWLRGYAVTGVIAEHVGALIPGPSWWSQFPDVWFQGVAGVDLFFVISGFVISATLIPAIDKALLESTVNVTTTVIYFFQKRLLRLYPATLFWSAFILLSSIAFVNEHIWLSPLDAYRKFIASCLYIMNFSEAVSLSPFGYFWSLSIEMQFYIVFPFFLIFVRRLEHRLMALVALFAISAFYIPGGQVWWLFRCSGIPMGVLVYYACASSLYRRLQPRWITQRLVAPMITVLALFLLFTCSLPVAAFPYFATALITTVAAVLVFFASFNERYISAFGLERVLDWIGTRSYSIYLCHIPLAFFVRSIWIWKLFAHHKTLTLHYWRELTVCWIIALIIAAELSYRLLEVPFQKLAHRGRTRTEPIREQVPAGISVG